MAVLGEVVETVMWVEVQQTT